MSEQIRPLGSQVLIKRDETETKTASGIILPGAKEKPAKGLVVSVGPGKYNAHGEQEVLQVSPGERVIFGKYSGHELMVDDVDHVVIEQDQIIGVLNEQ